MAAFVDGPKRVVRGIPAGRGVLGQALNLVAPGCDGGRKVGHAGRGTAERLPKRKGPHVRTLRTPEAYPTATPVLRELGYVEERPAKE